jgi:hypothetical protein
MTPEETVALIKAHPGQWKISQECIDKLKELRAKATLTAEEQGDLLVASAMEAATGGGS